MKGYLTVQTNLDPSVSRDYKFLVLSVKGSEGLCRDFSYDLELISKERLTDQEFERLLGEPVTVLLAFSKTDRQKGQRWINGVVYHLKEVGMNRAPHAGESWHYQATIGSWLTRLQHVKDCRIFQKNGNTSLTIVKELLTELELRNFRLETSKTYPRREYVCQFSESIYCFLVRLLQEDGILWRFEHREGKHVLVLFDDAVCLPEIGPADWGAGEGVYQFRHHSDHNPIEVCQLADFNYERPSVATVTQPANAPDKRFRHFTYPGGFVTPVGGEQKAAWLKQVFDNEARQFSGTSSIRLLAPGNRFRLNAPLLRHFHEQTYLVTELVTEATPERYVNRFTALDGKVTFVYPRSGWIDKPTIAGTQTAVVTGNENRPSQTNTDAAGRVRVRFHWDTRSPEKAEATSAFIRVAYPAAGRKRGFLFTPHISDEVVVHFEEGDIDRPLILGTVYSIRGRPPISPQTGPYQSAIQARAGRTSNQLLFDDQEGAETLTITAKKDLTFTVGNNLDVETENHITLTAESLRLETNGDILTGNILLQVGGNTLRVAGNSIHQVTGLGITGLVGGLLNNLAGGAYANVALGMVDNGSGGDMTYRAASIFNSTLGDVETDGKQGVKTKATLVSNTASDIVENTSGGDITQKAALAILTRSENIKNQLSAGSKTQAIFIKEQGEETVNDE